MDDRIIHPYGETKSITKEEYEKQNQPSNQSKELWKRLVTWSHHAMEILKEHGYKDFHTYGGTYKLVSHPTKIDPENNKVRDADSVLRAIYDLSQALSKDDKNLIANTSIAVGLAVSRAHAEPYEKTAKSLTGYKDRVSNLQKESFQKWIRENKDRVTDCRNIKDLKEIEHIRNIKISDETLKKWFKEIYPDQLKGGRPKNKP